MRHRGSGKTIGAQIGHLLALRSQDDYWEIGCMNAIHHFPQGETFAGARATAKQRDKIPTFQNVPDCRCLFFRQGRRRLVIPI
jgi:hypothetical protein